MVIETEIRAVYGPMWLVKDFNLADCDIYCHLLPLIIVVTQANLAFDPSRGR